MTKPAPKPPKPSDAEAPVADADWQPEIVAMVCRWCTYAGADLAGTSRLTYPSSVRLLRFPCTGRMNPMFIVKAFEQGADGVLVSGCHPGDCHYVQGNLFARRRFVAFKELMAFLGLDSRRLHFSWVSASEGTKWVKVVEQVHSAVREVGPARTRTHAAIEFPDVEPSGRASLDDSDATSMTERLRTAAAELLDEGRASVVIGYRQGTLPGMKVPAFASDTEQVRELVWDATCHNNLSVYLPRPEERDNRIAVVVKKCDSATVVGLLQEEQLEREKVTLIGMQCSGVRENGDLALKCRDCDGEVSSLCDIAITPDSTTSSNVTLEADPRDAAIAHLETLGPDERWNYWQEEFDRCIRCYACRSVCPLCYCETCIVEKHRPQWISPAIDETGNTAWNIVRAYHLAGRCTGCGECARVCPSDIRLDLINRKLALVVEENFDYRAGEDATASPPLTEFKDDDPEQFIL